MDWTPEMISEIFREYAKSELQKKALEEQKKASEASNIDDVLDNFDEFERRVNSDPRLKLAFKTLQEKFANDTSYREKVNPAFVEGVMMLNFDGEQD